MKAFGPLLGEVFAPPPSPPFTGRGLSGQDDAALLFPVIALLKSSIAGKAAFVNEEFLDFLLWVDIIMSAGEDTHHKKRSTRSTQPFDTWEGPVIKSISVVDPQGNQYEATYPKRAKGLVKKGRARFVDETTICLARPPYHTEDEMEETKTIPAAPEGETVKLDEAYVVAKIEQIMAESEHLRKTLEVLQNQTMSGEAVIGIGNMIEARERTNQAMIDLLKRIIVDKL